LDFGVVVSSHWGAKQILESGCLADSLGLDFFLVTDHYITPVSDSSVDAWAMLAALAAKTERITLGTCVTPIPFRPPQILAKVVATVDQISRGRAVLGVGAGWHKPEFDAYSSWDEDKIRVAKTVEGIKLMTKLWTSTEPFDFEGKYYTSRGAILNPKPVHQPHPPLWFGGRGEYLLKKVAAKYGEAWLPPVPGMSEEEYARILSLVHGEGKARPLRAMFNGELPEIQSNIEKYTKMGFEGVMLVRTPYEKLPTVMREFEELARSYKR
jgi:alkanesulfonate monooxygenase SsuD/methylene tetrahydromethanopterin reductase-like flavin-dependent oxidoreductase (luciferase family)